jgi:tyrosyl-tRNA synthetase
MADPFLGELAWRGMLHQTTGDAAAAHLATPGRVGYAGFDPTSDSLTIGNYIPMKMLAHFQRAGHRPVVLLGGGTGLIGDPSGKSAERQLQTRDMVERNVEGQRRVFSRVIDFSAKGATQAAMVNNADWLCGIGYLEMLRDVGKHFSVNQMIARDSVRSRLENREQGISYTEFSYMLLQAYDFAHLHRTMGCTVQMGGADQWGNIVSGIDLVRRMAAGGPGGGAEAHGVTAPLVTASDGGKIGKTEKGAIWLTADRTSPFRFHQFWLNTPDTDAVRFLRWFTFLPRTRVDELAHALATRPHEREAQRVLANEMTELFHGVTERARAEAAARALFSGEVADLDAGTIAEIAAGLPTPPVDMPGTGPAEGGLARLLVDAGAAASNREAREFLQAGSVQVNGARIGPDTSVADVMARAIGGHLLIRRGKKSWHAVRVRS